MARKLRVQYPGAIYHLMNRGDRREPIFTDDHDRCLFMETLDEACQYRIGVRTNFLHNSQPTTSHSPFSATSQPSSSSAGFRDAVAISSSIDLTAAFGTYL